MGLPPYLTHKASIWLKLYLATGSAFRTRVRYLVFIPSDEQGTDTDGGHQGGWPLCRVADGCPSRQDDSCGCYLTPADTLDVSIFSVLLVEEWASDCEP